MPYTHNDFQRSRYLLVLPCLLSAVVRKSTALQAPGLFILFIDDRVSRNKLRT